MGVVLLIGASGDVGMEAMDISLIPGVMRRSLQWNKAPQLMESWFRSPPNPRPECGPPDTTTIRMDLALGFARARQVFDALTSTRAWLAPRSQSRIAQWLISQNRLTGRPTSFGIPDFGTATPAALINDCVCTRPVGGLLDPLDDMYGTLGRFRFPRRGARGRPSSSCVGSGAEHGPPHAAGALPGSPLPTAANGPTVRNTAA